MTYTATIYFTDGTTETVVHIDDHVLEWFYEEFDQERNGKSLYFSRTDGATVMRRDNIRRIDLVQSASEQLEALRA